MATFAPMRLRLVGHRDVGIVSARWRGPFIELEDGTRYGPSAIYSVSPSEPEPPPQLAIEHLGSAILLGRQAFRQLERARVGEAQTALRTLIGDEAADEIEKDEIPF